MKEKWRKLTKRQKQMILGGAVVLIIISFIFYDEDRDYIAVDDEAPEKAPVEEQEPIEEEPVEEEQEPEQAEAEEEHPEADTEEDSSPEIDVSMYNYTEDIEVTDAIEVNNHITLMIDMNPNTEPGLAFQHVLDGTYDFLQQEAMEDVDTVGVNIRQDGNKTSMFTARPDDLNIDDDTPRADLVLQASEVEMMMPEVEQYAEAMQLPVE